MANYDSVYRTNYFKVTDEEKWDKLFSKLAGEDLEDFSGIKNGVQYHGFGGYNGICYDSDKSEDYMDTIDEFMADLCEILPKGEAAIYTETGNESLRYVAAYSIIATKDGVQSIDLQNAAVEKAKNMLNNKEFETEMDY